MTTPPATRDQVFATVDALLREVIGQDWAKDLVIRHEDSFVQDLEIESIDFVVLASKLQTTYGDRVDFASWLAKMELEEIIGLRVGQVVDFITECISKDAKGTAAPGSAKCG